MTLSVETQVQENKPDIQNIPNQQVSTQPQISQNITEKEPESAQEVNWKKYREQRVIERKQKEEAEKRATEKAAEAEALKAAMEAILNKQPSQSVQQRSNFYENTSEEISQDEQIERKVEAALQKRLQQEDQRRAQIELQQFPQRLAQNMQDFNQVCSTENLDYLDFHYPEVTAAFAHMPDGYDKWSNVYKAVKRFVPNTSTKQDLKKMEKNLQKPGSISLPADMSQDGKPIMSAAISEQKKAENWARMKRALSGVS